ncbi:hypothetical protein NQ315_000392 [Exocentrus adspersus]|uniref:Peroxidase n=1 Tax=Exocentrus adspersus TaxID=1586481 RepID=A0AAV8VMT5_9CUCU|nr:hypothetical protein NQ315_000392 [Exocentrus adspersus]
MGTLGKQWTTMLLLLTTILTAHADDTGTNRTDETDDRNILTSRILLANNQAPTLTENESEQPRSEDRGTIQESRDAPASEAETTKPKEEDANNEAPKTTRTEEVKNSKQEETDSWREKKVFGTNTRLGFFKEVHVVQKQAKDDDDGILVEITDEGAGVTRIRLEEKALDNAVKFGIQTVEDLVRVKEPVWYNMGLFLEEDHPASKVAAFGKPMSQKALEVSKFGLLTLEASRKMAESFPENVSRQAAGFPGSFHPRQLEDICPLKGTPRCPSASRRYRTADGTCNNLVDPWKGSAMLPMQRFLPPAYDDGIQSIRRSVLGLRLPSARQISVDIHGERNRELPSVTLMFMQWGQFIDHDVTSVVKSRSFNGSVPQCCARGGRGDPFKGLPYDWFLGAFGIRCIEFTRSAPSTRVNCDLGWREQINQVTSYIDASAIYGSDVESSDAMRTFRNGKLIYGRSHHPGPLQPPDPPGGELCRGGALTDDCFQTGDGRVSEQPGLTALHTVWVRFHNRVATALSKFNTHWSDEKVFQETRKIVYSIIQHITYREFLPIVLGPEVVDLFELRLVRKGYYKEYDSKVSPAIANSFSTAAFRFGHSMVQNSFVRTDHKHRPLFNNVSLHEELENFENIWSFGSVDRLLLGFANQPAQARDEFICDELSNHLFQSSGAPFGLDLAAINVQRGRDHGIPSYTTWREPCGLSPIRSWKDLKGIFNSDSVKRFRSLYHHVDDIDLFSGGLAEKPVRGGVVGPTFACIIAQQFLNLRKGDRFWYENGGFASAFTPAQLQQIRHVTLSQVLCYTMDEIETIQPFVFLSADNFRNVRLPCDSPLLDNFDLSPWGERGFNHIKKREVVYANNLRRTKRSKTKTTTTTRPKTTTKTKTNTKRKQTAGSKLKIKISNVTASNLENKYGGSVHVTPNSIPPRPHSYYSDNDVTYMVGVVPAKTTPKLPERPLEVNIKIQYYLPTTEKTTTTTRPTRKKKKNSTRKPVVSYGNPVLITQRPSTKAPQVNYPIFLQSPGYDDVRPDDLFEKPRPSTGTKRPSYGVTDIRRPVQVYDRPTVEDYRPTNDYRPNNNDYRPSNNDYRPSNNDYRPSNNAYRPTYNDYRPTYTYSYDDTTKKTYIIRPQTHYQTVYEDLPHSTTQRPYYYDTYQTRRPGYRPQQQNYDDELYDLDKRPAPASQSGYNRGDPINDVYAQVFSVNDRVGDVPKKPTFGQDYLDHDKVNNKPVQIYAIAHIHKLDINDQIDDKLDFKTRLVTKRKDKEDQDDRRFVKISSVKAGVILAGGQGELYTVQQRDGETDLRELGREEEDDDKIRVVEIDVAPSEVEENQWLVYNATEEIMPMLPVPDINENASCSSELPRPMKSPKVSQKLEVKDGTGRGL